MARPLRRRGAGFTLLELIVVLGIFGVVAVMAYGGLNSILKSRTHIAASMERTATLQKAFLRLRNDFQQMRARTARDGFGESQPALVTRSDGSVEFTRSGWRNPASQPRSTLERVAYRLDDDKLTRASWRAVDRAQDLDAGEVVLLDKVRDVSWRFLDKSLEWQSQWPPASLTTAPNTAQCPPSAVELTLDTEDLGEVRLLFSAANQVMPTAPPAPPGSPAQPPAAQPIKC